MRINPKSLTLALALTATLAASSALAAPRTRDERPPREPNVIERIINSIKKQIRTFGDGIIVPPPSEH